jgi:protein tyrosine/serine phosphatase
LIDVAIGESRGPRPAATSAKLQKPVRVALLIGAAVAIATTAIVLWSLVLRDRFVPKRFGVVVPGKLFRSGQISRFLIADVVSHNEIGTIIDLNGLEPDNSDQQAELDIAKAKGIRHMRFPLRGNATGAIDHYAGAVAAIVESEREGRPVLVHCAAGTQRTGACVSFYRLLVRHDPPESVYQELKRYGWNPRSDQVLVDYVNGHIHELAQLLVQLHVIEREPSPLPVLHP